MERFIMIFYNVISNVDEMDSVNETYFTTTNKDLAEKYLQKYNDVKSKFEFVRYRYEEANDQHFNKLVFEKCGFKRTDADYFNKLCDLTDEERSLLDDGMDKFIDELPLEIKAGIFTMSFPELTIVESSDEMNFERFFYDSADEDVKEYLKSLI